MSRLHAAQIAHVTRRALLRTVRQPGHLFFSLVFPLIFLAMITSGLDRASALPGFPGDSFLAFALAIPFVHGSLFAAINAGVELARDIENGFLNRLALTPASSLALVLGHLLAAVSVCVLQAVVYLAVGLLAGVELAAGIAGAFLLVALAGLVGLAFGAIGTFVALRGGTAEAVQGMFPLLFVAFFLSSMNLPRNLIEADWFRAVATANPISYVIEAIRSLIILGWDAQALALGFACVGGLVVVALAASAAAFGERMTRT